jgi:hypothetical protein
VTIEKCRGDLKLQNTRMLHQRCPNLMSGSEISALVPSYQINGQVFKASASFMAFNTDVAGEKFLSIDVLND